ncbi:MAG: hypothetical protein EA383_17260 [Spirochaetaceae bacterium]|nr:MAG: hypothetical protein EA383_17260 [Spirochaetaceae bacterium]
MQPSTCLRQFLENNADGEHYLFTVQDLHSLFPDRTEEAMRVLLGRAVRSGLLERVCHGLYLYPRVAYPKGRVLYHAAARARCREFNYLSLESVLSDHGVISQVPVQHITLMSSGRSYRMRCGTYGTVEFIHTNRKPERISAELHFDRRIQLWRASVALAVEDMRHTRRATDLIDWSLVHELA